MDRGELEDMGFKELDGFGETPEESEDQKLKPHNIWEKETSDPTLQAVQLLIQGQHAIMHKLNELEKRVNQL